MWSSPDQALISRHKAVEFASQGIDGCRCVVTPPVALTTLTVKSELCSHTPCDRFPESEIGCGVDGIDSWGLDYGPDDSSRRSLRVGRLTTHLVKDPGLQALLG